MKAKATRYTLILMAAGVLAAGFLLGRGGEAPVASAPVKPVRSTPAPAAPAAPEQAAAVPSSAQQLPAGVQLVESVPGSEGEHGEFTTSTDVMKQKIFKTEPLLARFDDFRQHALLDSNGREEYHKLLTDKRMLEQTRRELLRPVESEFSTETNIKRLMQIDYLREALAWKENPEREQLLSRVENIIREDSFEAGMDPELKRSVAATKMELYEIFHGQAPERAKALVQAARGTRLEKLMEYIATANDNRLAKERELGLQAMRPATP